MKLAVIPPFSMLETAAFSTYHLMLAQLANHPDYLKTYQVARSMGDFVILDNGAAEDSQVSNEELFRVAELVKPQEIVLPDVMRDPDGTFEAIIKFMMEGYVKPEYQYMAVVQSAGNLQHARDMIDTYAEMDWVDTIGLPRHLLQTCSDRTARINLALETSAQYGGRFQIHLLGASPLWSAELELAAKALSHLGHVRGMDTSMPFNYGIKHASVKGTDYIKRVDNYFEYQPSEYERNIIIQNIIDMLEWAKGKDD